MKISPVRDILLIKADKPRSESESGLLIHEDWKTLPLTGTVLAVGPDVSSAKVGDRVGFNRYASEILPNDERLINERQLKWLEN